MADVLTHNIDQIVNRLTTFQRTALPKATRRTVSQLGFDLARKDLPQYMQAVFDNPVPFTLNSLKHPTGYKVVSNYEVQLNFRQMFRKEMILLDISIQSQKLVAQRKRLLMRLSSLDMFTRQELFQAIAGLSRSRKT